MSDKKNVTPADAKAKAKNIFAYFKHLVKDPIRTIPEADARKKEIMPILYVSIGIAVVGVLLDVLFELGFSSILTMIGGVGIVFCVFLLVIIKKAKDKFKALTCDDCNTMIDIHTPEEFAKYVTYTIDKETVDLKVSHPDSKDGQVAYIKAEGSSDVTISVSFTCPKCGKVKTFKYYITPFKCKDEVKKVGVLMVPSTKTSLELKVRSVLDVYKSGDRNSIPFSIASIHHPNYANREKPQVGHEQFNGVSIIYHRTADEMVEGLFIRNELNGKIVSK